MSEEYKGYKIVSAGGYGMKEIKALGKGSVHMSLRGLYTTDFFAKRAIDVFIAANEKKVVKDGNPT